MRAEEFLSEAYSDPGIRKVLQKKGYKYLGQGVDQTAYLAPDGMILKIFGTSRSSKNGSLELTRAQKTFKAYADYCKAHANNPFLPQFSDWNMFQYKGKPYLQIKMERLFEFNAGASGIEDILADIAENAENSKDPKRKEQFINKFINERKKNDWWSYDNVTPTTALAFKKLIGLIGENGFNQLWDTIYDLRQVSKKLRLSNLDLHSGNFMLASDGQIIISDPFFAGWGS